MVKKLNSFLRKLWGAYSFTAVTLLSALVVLVLLNGILSVTFIVKDYFSSNPVSKKYGHSTVKSTYQGSNEGKIDTLLKETWSRPYIYEPFTQFKERPYRGTYVNVDDNGFRFTENQGPWPPQSRNLNIFLFGGSTTFGYGVPDNQTVASYLQEYLTTMIERDVRIYNFGRGHYYSTQERILFEELLASGFVPDMAIFIDGLNDFYYNSNEPLFTDRFREFVAQGATNKPSNDIPKTSIGRAVKEFANRLSATKLLEEKQHNEQLSEQAEANANIREYADANVINLTINRYLKNKEMIEAVSNSLGVIPMFVWQPVPTYNYDQSYHPFSKGGYGRHTYSQYGYIRMAELFEGNLLSDNFLWCADIQKGKKEPLYVDKVHYSSSFSKQFAKNIADLLIKRSPDFGAETMGN